jgi:hypothetical protein
MTEEPLEETGDEEVIGNSLDRYIGVWSATEEAEFRKSIEVFEEIDESFWA